MCEEIYILRPMKEQNPPPLNQLDIAFLTMGGLGYAKKAPGTVGSAGTLPLLYVMGIIPLPSIVFIPIVCLLTVGSCFVADSVEKRLNVHDPKWIVIDEALGMIVTWLLHPSNDPVDLLLVFAFFRFFDITKIWPINLVENKVPGGWGTVLDDIVAGLMAGVVYYFVNTSLF
jgi:phosphatidylglycerophosphatase A